MDFFNNWIEKGIINRLSDVVEKSFVRMTYTDAVELLLKSKKKFEFLVKWGCDLQSEHERYITEEAFNGCPVIITDYPKDMKAFYMRLNDDGKTVAAMDMLVPRVGELIGGSQREERLDYLERNTEDITAHTNNICNAMEREGCCQPNGKTKCCHNPPGSHEDSVNIDLDNEFGVRKRKGIKNQTLSDINNKMGRTSRKTYTMPTWRESWESEDVYAALALIGAAVSVAVAYNCYRRLS